MRKGLIPSEPRYGLTVAKSSSNAAIFLLPTVTLNENLKAPIKKGDVVGHVKYEVEGITYEADLLANSDVKPSRVFIKILIFVIILVFAFLYLKAKQNQKEKRKVKYYKGR